MKCSFSRLLYPKRLEEARDGSYMIALFKPNEKLLDAQHQSGGALPAHGGKRESRYDRALEKGRPLWAPV